MEFQGQVLIFSITGCPFCKRAKALLNDLKIQYVDVNLEKYPQRRHEMQERTGRRTVPQIFFNAHHIGGFEDLKKLYEENKLDALIKEVVENDSPPDAPLPPPEEDQQGDGDSEEMILLPSQRKGSGGSCFDCTPDEMAALAQEIQERSHLVKSHTYHLVKYKNSFIGRELVEWMIENKGNSREDAIKLGKELVRRHFIHHVAYEHDFEDDHLFYRFLGDAKTRALNARLSHHCLPRKANEVADDLRKLILEIYSEHLSPDGFSVDYQGISTSRKFEEYVRATAELKRVDLSVLQRNEKIAFFCNIYNALVIHAFVVRGPPTNMLRRLLFFYQASYIIGGQEFSLNDMESGVLRANRKPVGAIKRPFSSHDARLPVALETPEPRVHFALVCGAKSCPPIKTYSAENIDEELTVSTEAFFEDDKLDIDLSHRVVSLSTILKWYRVDFGRNDEEVLEWVHSHMAASEKKNKLRKLINEGNFKIKYQVYNWDVNSS